MDLDHLWQNVQEELKIILAPAVYQTFVAKTILVSLQGHQATVGCPNTYLADINRRRYHHLFKSSLDNQAKIDSQLEFIVQDTPLSDNLPSTPLFSAPTPPPTTSTLNSRYTFEQLIVGNSNNFAFAAAQGIVANPGLTYNPFFIWGGVGVGKTHLMQAIGHELLRLHPQYHIRYFPAETFGNDLIASLRSKSMNQFKAKYRQLDCILVDDVQFIAGKEYIQEEFFHTFNALHLNGKQIILTSDRKPDSIKDLEDRLVSRFLGGLTVDIQPPDYEMRLAIINQKCENRGLHLSPAAAAYLADNLQSNIRHIEGKLQQIIVKAQSLHQVEITPDFIQANFSPHPTLSNTHLTARHVISVCAKHFNLKTNELTGPSRQKDLVFARHFTAYLLLSELKLPLDEVGQLLGGRDHTSIMHARDKIESDLASNSQAKSILSQIKTSLLQ